MYINILLYIKVLKKNQGYYEHCFQGRHCYYFIFYDKFNITLVITPIGGVVLNLIIGFYVSCGTSTSSFM